MARPGFGKSRRALFVVLLGMAVSFPLASASPAGGLPIPDDPIRDAVDGVRDRLDRTRDRAEDAASRLKDRADDAASDIVGGVSKTLGGGGSVVSVDSSQDEASPDRQTKDPGKRKGSGAGRSGRAGSAPDADAGDVDELARAGNEVSRGQGGQQGVGISLPVPQQGGSNRPLGFTGLSLLFSLFASLLLGTFGLALLTADMRRRAVVSLG